MTVFRTVSCGGRIRLTPTDSRSFRLNIQKFDKVVTRVLNINKHEAFTIK